MLAVQTHTFEVLQFVVWKEDPIFDLLILFLVPFLVASIIARIFIVLFVFVKRLSFL